MASRNRLADPRPGDVVLFLHAHPDDESLFTGGTIARLASAGAKAALVTATLGELGRVAGTPERAGAVLGAIRGAELLTACRVLGIGRPRLLGGHGRWSDSGVIHRSRPSNSLSTHTAEAAAQLLEVILRVRPHVLVTYAEDGLTGHPDHIACHEIALRAASLRKRCHDRLETLAFTTGTSDRSGTVTIDVTAERSRKIRALSCHRSQAGSVAVQRYLPSMLDSRPAAHVERYSVLPV